MIEIRRLNCFDYPKLKKLISYLCVDDNDKLAKNLMQESVGIVNAIMPLALKFQSESFILVKDKDISGLITILCCAGNPYKINITRLIFKENEYEIGKMLTNFVIQKYGGKGAHTFTVMIDDSHDELFDLFINGCGFRQSSSETLWKNDKPLPQKHNLKYRQIQNSDAKNITALYNSELNNIFKPSLERTYNEFKEPFFPGFCNSYKKRYMIENEQSVLAYFSITTSDNLNYIFDITTNSAYNLDYDDIINIMLCEVASKKHAFYPLVKHKKYMNEASKLEQYLTEKKYYPVQTQHILVKDFYKQIDEKSTDWKVFIMGENSIST